MTALVLPVSESALSVGADILRRGGLVAMPTETVYGLACDASNPEAVARLYAAKERPRFNPLIAHVASLEMAQREAVFSQDALELAEAYWPGPLTLVLPVASTGTVCSLARAGLETVALRMPAHTAARGLIEAFGGPLVAPSANRSGHVSPTRAAHVADDLRDRIDLILDGGPSECGIESTIVALTGPEAQLLRAGALETAKLRTYLDGGLSRPAVGGPVTAPGQLKRHYAPKAHLRLNATAPEPGEAWLGFGPSAHEGANLSPTGNLQEAAASLFTLLRDLDARHDSIAVAAIPHEGLGEAINDRLARAAHRD